MATINDYHSSVTTYTYMDMNKVSEMPGRCRLLTGRGQE